MLKKAGFNNPETQAKAQNISLHPLENTFGDTALHCGSKNNPTAGQRVNSLKTNTVKAFLLEV
jgi:hypothetical protein